MNVGRRNLRLVVLAVVMLALLGGAALPVVAQSGLSKAFFSWVIAKKLTVQGDTEIQGDATIDEDLTVTGDLTVDDVTLGGSASLGNAVTDATYLYGQLLTHYGSSNWQTIADAGARTRKTEGALLGYTVTGWGSSPPSYFNGAMINSQIGVTTTIPVRGAELKATCNTAGTGTCTEFTGALAKVTAKISDTIVTAKAVDSDLDIDGTITTGYNFYAQREGSGTLTTGYVLGTAADTWTAGLYLDNATLTNDIVLQNGEIIKNSTDGTVDVTATTLDVSGAVKYGSNNLYPVGYASDGTAVMAGNTDTFTGTTVIDTGLTTVTSAVCVPSSQPAATAATCWTSWTTTTVTLNSLKADGATEGDTGTTVSYLIFGVK